MRIIPIGLQCTTTCFSNEIVRNQTLPFDWMFATLSFVFAILELLLEKNMNIEELVKEHFFYCKNNAKFITYESYTICDNGSACYNSKYNIIFPHDTNNAETITKYIRRIKRLKDLILNSSEELRFIYISQSSLESGNFTINNSIVVKDVYVYLSKIYRLIGKYRDNYKFIIFDSIDNEDIQVLDKNIHLYRLNKCNCWTELLHQLREYRDVVINLH